MAAERKRVFFVVGFTGSGKSTLSNCLINKSAQMDDLLSPNSVSDGAEAETKHFQITETDEYYVVDILGAGSAGMDDKKFLKDFYLAARELVEEHDVKKIDAVIFVQSAFRLTDELLNFFNKFNDVVYSCHFRHNTILVLTKSDEGRRWIENNNQNEGMQEILDFCSNRYITFNLKMDSSSDSEEYKRLNLNQRQQQIDSLLAEIRRISIYTAIPIEKILPDLAKVAEACFPKSSKIKLANGMTKQINELQHGDLIVNYDLKTEKSTYCKFLSYLHFDNDVEYQYLLIKTANSKSITISSNHLMAKLNNNHNKVDYVYANDIKIDDMILVHNDQEDNSSKFEVVNSVNEIYQSGLYAPLTDSGTLFVDSILVSCYASFKSHYLAHLAFSPYRLLIQLDNLLNFKSLRDAITYKAKSNEDKNDTVICNFKFRSQDNSSKILWYAKMLAKLPFVSGKLNLN